MLTVKNLSAELGEFKLEGVSFEVPKGDYLVLLGPSGAGKSVVLEAIVGLVPITKGTIILNGRNIERESVQHRGVGLVFQDFAVFPHLTVRANIGYPLKAAGFSKVEAEEAINAVATKLAIVHLLHRKPDTLSGGELQRVAIARTLVLKPLILLLDEPLSSLDAQLRSEIRALLRQLNREGQTIVHVTHDYEEAISLAKNVAIIHKGVIVQTGNPKQVFQNPKSPFIAELTGVRNFFDVKVRSVTGSDLRHGVTPKGLDIKFYGGANGASGYILIDDKSIFLSVQQTDTSALNSIMGEVVEVIPSRIGCEVVVDAIEKIFVAVTSESLDHLGIVPGKSVWLAFKASSVRFIEG
ncbi:ABC transporter ATP-binding protein [Williamwhitmania taraxaci]|uniref:Molybdate transport system ATP-binding protein/molybdate/tungstate transport system ATP-binding protein n=1 Tax=Williamwhitmania taraxaci TaxID=1640674 RepID=A0A1G6N7I9_9BACT|nr:ABC transporter ATP-binding protein [Williamwhitmania taraxaci]SDC63763.1 molybdate transport system ATP-binding protein/molybdate/tungstate transport system ATP-binding protein [Williamwhitmania taraxaci]